MCFSYNTYFNIIIFDYFIHCIIDIIIVLFLSFKFISSHGIMYLVLSRADFRILRTKVFQDLSYIWWVTGAIDDKSAFGSILSIVNAHFVVLAKDLTYLGLSIWWDSFSFHFSDVTRTVGIFLNRFLKRRFYITFINIFCYSQKFIHINSFFKSNAFSIKPLHICLISPGAENAVEQDFI